MAAAKRGRYEDHSSDEDTVQIHSDEHNARRTMIKQYSYVADGVRKSLQSCLLSENLQLIEDKISKIKDPCRMRNLSVLRYILDCLTAKLSLNGRDAALSYMLFSEAFDIYKSHISQEEMRLSGDGYLKDDLRNLLCHPDYGLCIYLLRRPKRKEIIILRPDHIDLIHVLSFLVTDEETEQQNSKERDKMIVNKEFCKDLMSAVDTEWDRRVMRVMIAAGRTNPEFEDLGFNSDLRSKDKKRVQDYIALNEMLQNEARTLVGNDLVNKKKKITAQIQRKKALIMEKKLKWTETQIGEREEELEKLTEKLTITDQLLKQMEEGAESKSLKSRYTRKRLQLIENRRMKKRKRGSGRKRMIDEDDERFIEKCIASKATAHGRRKDAVWYLGHRVKVKNLLGLLNQHHMERNLPLLKSTSALYHRSRPKYIKSRQAKRHIGLGLFCCKKSPKSEDKSTILTHFCRASKKLTSSKLCHEDSNLVLYRSFDDKAYLCPGTKTGMDSVRKQKILTTVNEELARKFKKYDFPNSMLSCTPGVYLYMTKSLKEDEKNNTILAVDSQDIVVAVKSKYWNGSSGSVWSSHSMENRHREAVLHEVSNSVSSEEVPISLRNILCEVKDTCNSFLIQNNQEDVLALVAGENGFRQYERKKTHAIHRTFENGLKVLASIDVTDKCINFAGVSSALDNSIVVLKDTLEVLEDLQITGGDLIKYMDNLVVLCEKVIHEIGALPLPQLRPRVVDLTDAGPGVGINNHEVYYRIAQEVLICKYDHYSRIHLAPGDSSQNEVERIQSSVGDAIADGGYVEWEHRKKFHDLTDEEVLAMTPDELTAHEVKRMKHNAYKVCDDIASRIDGNISPNGYMKAYPSKKNEKLFFWDTEFLNVFINEQVDNLPGSNFYIFLKKFMESHARVGEKYLEVIKCSGEASSLCRYCSTNPWSGSIINRIPQPVPDYTHTKKYKYKHFSETDNKVDGIERTVDDFNPRVQLKAWYEKGLIAITKPDQLEKFSKKFIVDQKLVEEELTHMHQLNLGKVVRSKARKEKNEEEKKKGYEDFEWATLIEGHSLKKLKVASLNKYLERHDLKQFSKLKKPQKIEAIISHYHAEKFLTSESNEESDLDEDDDAEEELNDSVLAVFSNEMEDEEELEVTDAEDEEELQVTDVEDEEELQVTDVENQVAAHVGLESDEEDWEDASWITKTRSGRFTGNPNLSTHRARKQARKFRW